MERVFITGRGLITPLGNGLEVNLAALKSGKSGIVRAEEFVNAELPCQVGGVCDENPELDFVDRKQIRFCPPVGVMSLWSVCEALREAGIAREELPELKIALIGGVAGSNCREIYEGASTYRKTMTLRGVSPLVVPRVMPSSAISNVSLILGIKGESYDVSAACASGALSVIAGMRLIRSGEYDMVIAGGAEHLDWAEALGFCACRALATKFNDNPAAASRPFDKRRDGFVLAAGASYVILESERSVRKRGVRPITELVGFGANSNASDMVVPNARSSCDVMHMALSDAGLKANMIDYVNTHGTATPVGDPVEMAAIKEVFGSNIAINSTKSQTGHMVGATGAAEIIFSSLMLEHDFISPSINLDEPEDEFHWADLVRETREKAGIKYAVSNSFAFGGSNACVVLKKAESL